MRIYLLYFVVIILSSCSQDSGRQIIKLGGGGEETPIFISFSNSQGTVLEGNSISVILILDKASTVTTDIAIDVSSTDVVYGQDYTTDPTVLDSKIILQVEEGTSTVNFTINTFTDSNDALEIITFTISNSDHEDIAVSNQNVYSLSISDVETVTDNCNPDIATNFTACFDKLSENELNVVSWNIEFFDAGKISAVKELIEIMQPDVIAVQEVDEVAAFSSLGSQLDGWESRVVDVSGRLDFGYLYKTCEITAFDNPSIILDGPVEPRPAIQTKITHISGLEVILFNIHLKCCGVTGSNEANRRAASSKALQDHINTNHSDDNIIILGDWNDDIGDGTFDNFLSDPNFSFADETIGNGSSTLWSYPSWPSHLDHILISNELSDNLVQTKTLVIDDCLSGYLNNVSDHRPVMATFTN